MSRAPVALRSVQRCTALMLQCAMSYNYVFGAACGIDLWGVITVTTTKTIFSIGWQRISGIG
jgi:hypothetical protein